MKPKKEIAPLVLVNDKPIVCVLSGMKSSPTGRIIITLRGISTEFANKVNLNDTLEIRRLAWKRIKRK